MPHPMPTDPEVLAYIARTDSFYPPGAATLTVAENRARYDRYAAAMRQPRPDGVTSEDFAIAASMPPEDRSIPARRYRRAGQDAFPGTVLLYLHGGGFVLGGLDSHDDACGGICGATGIEVVSVAYRLAPEHLHPAQGDDAEAAFLHLAHDGRHRRVIVCGDSAGGTLAAALCLRRRTQGPPHPVGQVLIYPGLGGDRTRGSYLENADAPHLSTKDSDAYFALRTGGRSRAEVGDPDLMPLLASDLSGLPPAFVVTADIDPLRDDGRDYVERLRAGGVQATWRNEPQLVHAFLRARHMSRRAAASFDWICRSIETLAARAEAGAAGADERAAGGASRRADAADAAA